MGEIAAHAKRIVAHLAPYVEAKQGGKVFVASDMIHFWNIAQNSSQKLRVIVLFKGEIARGDFSIANVLNRVDRQWCVGITRGRGFSIERGDTLTDAVGNAPPLFEIYEDIRDIIRAMLDVSQETPAIDFKTSEMWEIPGYITDALLIHFSTANDIPAIVSVPENPAIPIDENALANA